MDVVRQRRQLVVSWLHSAALLGMDGGKIKVGFPPSESFARDSLLRPAQLSFLEGVAQELLGRAMKFEFVLDATLKAPEFSEMGLGFDDTPAPAAAPAPAPKAETTPELPKAGPKPEAPKAAAAPEQPAAPQVGEDFYNDPLIQSAMARFKAKLVPAG